MNYSNCLKYELDFKFWLSWNKLMRLFRFSYNCLALDRNCLGNFKLKWMEKCYTGYGNI